MRRLTAWTILRCGAVIAVGLVPTASFGTEDTASLIRKFLNVSTTTTFFTHRPGEMEALRQFYASRDFQPVWIGARSKSHGTDAVLSVLNTASTHGLDKSDYAGRQIALRSAPRTAVQRAQFDILLSKALARYGADMVGHKWVAEAGAQRQGDPVSRHRIGVLLQKAAESKNLEAYFDGLAPRSPRYWRLSVALADYRKIAHRGGWPVVPKGPLLRLGISHSQVGILRLRLAASGDLETGAGAGTRFDMALDRAVRRFQRRHGLAEDGVVGRRTRAALNVPINQRLHQIRINLQRRRSIPDNLGAHYIFVNMADFVLKVVRKGRTVLTMKVVVGTPYRQTPLFSATMTYIDFNPYWNIPHRIAAEEIIPRARRNRTYLIGQGIRIFRGWGADAKEIAQQDMDWDAIGPRRLPYRFRQDPGPRNALGRVKFMFPNRYDVYLHDTPARDLFSRDIRTFSHGCIRVENPLALAAHLLPDLSGHEIERVIEAGKRRVFHLSKPIPVYLNYLTAWVNKDGAVNFRGDVYRRDGRASAALH